MTTENKVTRAAVLTEADHKAIAEILNNYHACRFNNVTPEDMDFFKDLLSIYKETRSEVIKWVVKGVAYAVLLLIMVGMYFKWGHK